MIKTKVALLPCGAEDFPRDQKIEVPVLAGVTAEQRFKQMLDAALAADKEPDETIGDDYDFDLEEESIPLHSTVEENPLSRKDLYGEIKKAQRENQRSGGEDSASRKPAKTGRAERVDKKPRKKSSASESSAEDLGAEEENEDFE